MFKVEYVRRSVSIPKELDYKIEALKHKYNYKVKNELIIELLELGIIKYEEDTAFKDSINEFINRIDKVLVQMDNEN